MNPTVDEQYKGWTITVKAKKYLCANYSFDITDPDGYRQHVIMGGDSRSRAVERAREMIDMELAFADG